MESVQQPFSGKSSQIEIASSTFLFSNNPLISDQYVVTDNTTATIVPHYLPQLQIFLNSPYPRIPIKHCIMYNHIWRYPTLEHCFINSYRPIKIPRPTQFMYQSTLSKQILYSLIFFHATPNLQTLIKPAEIYRYH